MNVCEHCGASHDRQAPLCPLCTGPQPVEHTLESAARAKAMTADTWEARPSSDGAVGADLVGTTLLGQFEVVRKIGQGGFGTVYLAEQRGVERKAVIKVLHRRLAADPVSVKRFEREAKALARLDHHHLVKLYNFGETEDGTPFLTMEYGGERSLADVIHDEGALLPARVCRLGEQICEALAEAHARGVIHRDLKPANVLVAEKDGADWVKVVDVGIAKLLQGDEAKDDISTLTREGSIIGTPAYFSPEQSDGQRELDGRSDLYSLGVLLYETVSGELPFQGNSLLDFVRMHALEKPRPLRALGVEVGPLEAVIFRALEKDPDLRFATALEMREALRRAARSLAAPRRAPLLALAVLLLAAAGTVAFVAWRGRVAPAEVNSAKLPELAAVAKPPDAQDRTVAALPPPAPAVASQSEAPAPVEPTSESGPPRQRARTVVVSAPALRRPAEEQPAWAHLTVKAPRTRMHTSGAAWRARSDGGDLQLSGSSGSASLASADGAWSVRLVWARLEGGKLGLLFETQPASVVWQDDEPLGHQAQVVVEPGSPARFAFRSPALERELALLVRLEPVAPKRTMEGKR